jgi:DNA polymerase-3 subunit gamma/tau
MDTKYKVTALKWRPKKFEDVVCQSHITTTLLNAVKSGRIAHAYLFTGPRGVGKTTVARIFARAVNCLNPKDGEPCEECENCKLSLGGRGLDIIEIDGASNRGIDDMRSLQESARYTPTHGKYKIYIIDEIHMITREGFNAFLKTLEEPPEHVIFIGATTEPIKVFPTIISRCQRFDFRRIPLNEITSRLKYIATSEGIIIDDESLITIAKKGDGSMRDSQSIFDQVISFCGNDVTIQKLTEVMNLVSTEYYFKITDCIKEKNSKAGLEIIDFLVKHGYDIHEFILGLLDHFRNLIHTVVIGNADNIETSDEYKQKYIADSKFFSEGDLLRMMKLLSDLEIGYKYYNQPRLKFEMVLMMIIKMDKTIYIDHLLKEIEELKKKNNRSGSKLIPNLINSNEVEISNGYEINSKTDELKISRSNSRANESTVTVHKNNLSSNKIEENVSIKISTSSKPALNGEFSTYKDKVSQEIGVNSTNNLSHEAKELTLENIESKWDELLDEIMKQNRINLKTSLLGARMLNINGNILTLACDNEFQTEVIKSNKLFLHEKERLVYGFTFEMNPVVVARKKTAKSTDSKLGESKHPIVQALLDEFEAEPLV